MQVFHASRVLVLAAGLGVASTSFAAFAPSPQPEGGDTFVSLDLSSVLAGAQPGREFRSSMQITDITGETVGVVTMSGTLDLAGQLNFVAAVTNLQAVPTNFSFLFANPVTPPNEPLEARAYAVASVLDVNGDGAALSGGHEDGSIVHYLYTTPVDLGGDTIFDTQFLNSIVAGSFSTAAANDESSPAPTFIPLGAVPSVLKADVRFSVSPFDQATINGAFLIRVPSPGTASFLLVTGLAGLTRRRTRN